MATEHDQPDLDAQRRAYREWWASDRSRPLILQRSDNRTLSPVLFPRWWSKAAFNVRFTLMWMIGRLPWSGAKVWLYRRMGVRIGRGVYIAPGVFLDAFYPQLIELRDDCFLGIGCRIMTHDLTATFFRLGRVQIGRGSVVGAWSLVRCGVTLGARVTTGFCSVVVRDVPDGLTVVGVPAKPCTNPQEAR